MHTRKLRPLVPLALVLVVTPACKEEDGVATGGPIDSRTNAQKTSGYAADIVRQLAGGVGFVTADGSVVNGLLGSSPAPAPTPRPALPDPLPRPLLDLLADSPAVKRLRPVPIVRLATLEEDMDDTAGDLEILLRDRLLAEENVEERTETKVTYRLKPDPTCRALPSQQDPGTPPPLDEGCAADLAKLEVRIVATQHGDGARFQVLMGPDRHELSVIIIHSNELAWEVGLASAKRAGDYVNQALGKEAPATAWNRLEGRLRASVTKLGEDHVAIATAVLEPIDLDSAEGDAAIRVGKSDPLFRVTADGAQKVATIELRVGQTDVHTTWDPRDMGLANRDLHVSVGGVHGKVTLTDADRQLSFDGIGVGASSVAVRGTKIFALEMNPGDGRQLDLLVRLLAGDVPRFELRPRLDLSLMFNAQAVAADLAEPPGPEIADETYSLKLDGAQPVILEVVKEDPASGARGGLQVVAGKLVAAARTAPMSTITVQAPMCLVQAAMPPAGAHPMLGSFEAAACR